MFGIGVLAMLVLLFVFGLFAAVVTLIGVAFALGRGGAAILIGGVSLVAILVGTAIVIPLFAYTRAGKVRIPPSAWSTTAGTFAHTDADKVRMQSIPQNALDGVTTGDFQWEINGVPQVAPPQVTFSENHTTWRIAAFPLLFIGFGVIALLTLVIRRALGHPHSPADRRHGRIWPAFVALPVIAFLFFGVFHERSRSIQETPAGLSEALRQQQAAIATQQQKMAQRVASIQANVHQQIEQMNIHELMDKFDAPRIVLQAPLAPSAAPAAMVLAAATPTNTKDAEQVSSTSDSSAKTKKSVKSRTSAKRQADNNSGGSVAQEGGSDKNEIADVESGTAASAADAQPAGESPGPSAIASSPAAGATASRPAWTDDPPKRSGNPRREVIVTEEYATTAECYQAADVYLMLKAYERLEQLAGRPYTIHGLPSITFANDAILMNGLVVSSTRQGSYWNDDRLSTIARMGISPDYLRTEIIAKEAGADEPREYLETTERSVGPMKKLYMQVEFTPTSDANLLRKSESYYRRAQFGYVGMSAASILGLLTLVWGLVRFDTATKGYYTKRLFIGVPLGILGIVGLYVLAVVMGADLPH